MKPIFKSHNNIASQIYLKPLPENKTSWLHAYNESILSVSRKRKGALHNCIIKWREFQLKESSKNPDLEAYPTITVVLLVFNDVLKKREIAAMKSRNVFDSSPGQFL